MNPYENHDPNQYFIFRPSPPLQIVDEIKMFGEKVSARLQLAVDIGCGSGQMTQILAPHFQSVVGIDDSNSQIEEAKRRNSYSNVTYLKGSFESAEIGDESVDLVMVCLAIHWFNIPKFYAFVDRVLKPRGILAITGYLYPEPIIEDHTSQLYDLIEKWFMDNRNLWPAQHELLFNRYRNLPSLYKTEKIVEFIPVDNKATLAHLIGHLRSRSGIQNLLKTNPERAAFLLNTLQNNFMRIIGTEGVDPKEIEMTIRYNYFLIMSMKQEK